jgi:hypothetical protein
MLRSLNDDVTTIKPETRNMGRPVVLHDVRYIRKSLRLENTESGKSDLNSETRHRGGSVMVWPAISWYSLGPIITFLGRITAREYVDKLGNKEY